ncbi:MAG TPA: ATP-binding protein [bacterium]
MKWYNSLGVKIILSVGITVFVVNAIYAYLSLTIQESHLNEMILRFASELSETIKKSIKFDMIENRKEKAYMIMDTIGEQEGIERVRIYSSEGKIIFSTDKSELGKMVNKKAEACYACHSETKPLERLETSERGRIFKSENEYRILGMINPIYNEKECFSAACHSHSQEQKVLGVIDIVMSLVDVDAEIKLSRNQIMFYTLLCIVIISSIIGLIILIFVDKPVRELVYSTMRISEGNLGHVIPVSSGDEIGYLSHSFNKMTQNLKNANEEIQGWIKNLEKKVEERTAELKETQSQLFHSEKLSALGKIAASVAHEINNPLTGVFTYIKLMERRIEAWDGNPADIKKFKEFLATMGKEVERTSGIVRSLLDFARPKEPSKKKNNINIILEEALELLNNQLNIYNIKTEKNLGSVPEIMADSSQIKQVVLNIMFNALEAMEKGGVLSIKSFYNNADDSVVVEFRDTGVGILPENLPKIFDPFFTTKLKGTGLGLSVVYGIISKHNGKIDVKSKTGEGTVVKIMLPKGEGGKEK